MSRPKPSSNTAGGESRRNWPDESASGRLQAGAGAPALPDHDVHTAVQMGWGQLENGDLLREAEKGGFDLFIICDKNLRHQQNLAERRLAILELWTNHCPTLEKHWNLIRRTAEAMRPGEYRALESP